MDIKLLFDPIGNLGDEEKFTQDSLYRSVRINKDTTPELNSTDIAIIGITESRSEPEENNIQGAPDQIRKKLYALKRSGKSYNIADLGNLRNGHDLEETQNRLSELLNFLFEKEILPIIIGGTHDFDYAQFQAYELSDKLVTFLNVDAKVDLQDHTKYPAQHSHIHKVMLHQPNYLFNFIQLAYQSYLVSNDTLDMFEKLSFSPLRLGKFRDNPEEIEPSIREADMMSFDLSAISSRYMKATHQPNIFGLTGEEACQVAWYAGSSEKLSSVGFYGYDPSKDDPEGSSATVVSVMIWYFLEGFYQRRDKHEFTSKYYLKYNVALDSKSPAEIVFYKSLKTDKWWMEIPSETFKKGLYSRNQVVSCSYEDYRIATKGEVPERWISAFNKLT